MRLAFGGILVRSLVMPLELAVSHAGAKLLEVAHVAHRLSASPEFVRRLIRDRKLKAIRMGRRWRVDPADLEAFIDGQRTICPSDPPRGHPRTRLSDLPTAAA